MSNDKDKPRTKDNYTLAFDSSSNVISLCLWRNHTVCAQWSSSYLTTKAEILPLALANLLSQSKVSYDSIKRLCLVRGPGSYTGLRVSLALARGLRLSLQDSCSLKIYSLTSFEASSLAITYKPATTILVLAESFRSDWYAQAFRYGKALFSPRVLDDNALRLLTFKLLANTSEELVICGCAAERANEHLLADVVKNFPEKNSRLISGVAKAKNFAKDFSRPLVQGDESFYLKGDKALVPLYIGSRF